jgi:hypothetical protein
MQTCTRCNTSTPDHASKCPSCGASLPENSVVQASLQRMQQNPRVAMIQVSVAGDACPSCQSLQGTYSKEKPPQLPHPGCSHGTGCRCFYEPILTEIYP